MAANVIPFTQWGASAEDWTHLDLVMGLGADLLPVVSNPHAAIASTSSIRETGKLPSLYTAQREVVGIAGWTQRQSTSADIERWSRERDYGICIQTRRIRAIDVDIPDADQAEDIKVALLERYPFALRCRPNSSKFLLAFECPDDLTKRTFRTAHGLVELLASGQQFVAVGTHPSGARYDWPAGLLDEVPVLTLADVDALWADLMARYGTGEASSSTGTQRHQKLADVVANDPVAQHLIAQPGRVKRAERDGRLHIVCPWEVEHTSESSVSATTYWPAHTGGYERGHFACLHAHCEHRTDDEFLEAVEYRPVDEFAAIADEGVQPVDTPLADGVQKVDGTPAERRRFQVLTQADMAGLPALEWIVKGVLPRADLGVVYGASGSGKSFWVLDLAMHISLGREWRGHRVRKLRVLYVAAEGQAGVRKRLAALRQHHQVDFLPIGVIEGAPNLLERSQAAEVAREVQLAGGYDLIIMDTWAQVTAGANENSAEDMGRALAHCREIRRATGAMVLLVHHAGKDLDRGARGWSGLKAAADVEIEIVRAEHARTAIVSKLKDGEDGAEYGFALEEVILGFDADGDEISSCVVVPAEATGGLRRKAQLGRVEAAVMGALEAAGGVDNAWTAEPELLNAVCATLPVESGKRDTRAQKARKAMRNLIKTGCIQESTLGLRVAPAT